MSYKVTGKVYEAETDLGIPNLIVQAFDKNMLKDDNLGEAVTDSEGKFEMRSFLTPRRDIALKRCERLLDHYLRLKKEAYNRGSQTQFALGRTHLICER